MSHDRLGFDGFDAYGPMGFRPIDEGVIRPGGGLLAGEWTSIKGYGLANDPSDVTCTVIAPLWGPGQALRVACTQENAGRAGGISQTLPASYERIEIGATLRARLSSMTQAIVFGDAGVDQFAITLEPSGQVGVRVGDGTSSATAARGTLVALSDESISTGEVFNLVAQSTFSNGAGEIRVWLNNVLTSLNLTGLDTQATALSTANEIRVICTSTNTVAGGSWLDIDHFYWRGWLSDPGAQTPFVTNPQVETQFPTGDYSIDFSFGAAILGADYSATTATNAPGAGQLFLRQWTPDADGTLDNVTIVPAATSIAAKFKPVAYSDSAGAPNTLLSAGPELVGCTADTALTGALTSPQAITAGTPIWLGFITDTSVALNLSDDTLPGRKVANTYGSGAPGTAPAMTLHQAAWVIFGAVSGQADEFWSVVDNNPFARDRSYMTSAGVGDEDLFSFPILSNTPTTIYAVAMKAVVKRSDSGARTMDLRIKSAATTGSGLQTGLAVAADDNTIASVFEVDPDTSAAWNASGVNLMYGGYKIAS